MHPFSYHRDIISNDRTNQIIFLFELIHLITIMQLIPNSIVLLQGLYNDINDDLNNEI